MLVSMKPILEKAKEEGYCVAAPNATDSASALAIIRAAERTNSPIIIDISRGNFSLTEFNSIASAAATFARDSKVPVAINLDHGKDYDSCIEALHSECTSIMADRSSLPYEENVKEVADLARIAHVVGKTMEAELGHVGTNVGAEKEIESSIIMKTQEDVRKGFTDPIQAKDYVERTNIDALAVAVGSVHGAYPKGMEPKLDFDLMIKLKEAVPVPLVMHGGSGTSPEDMKKLGKAGICKINLMADLLANGIKYTSDFVEEHKGYDNVYHASTAEMKKFVASYYKGLEDKLVEFIKLLGSENKA